MIKKSIFISVSVLAIIAVAVLAMTNENNYHINSCPNAPHNQNADKV